MKPLFPLILSSLLLAGNAATASSQPFDEAKHFHRLYENGKMLFDFDKYKAEDFRKWQSLFRTELKNAIGLSSMERMYPGYAPTAQYKETLDFDGYTLERWVIYTEPDIPLPMDILKPKNLKGRTPLVITMQGHNKNPETFAFLYKDEKEKEHILEGDRDVAVQAVKEGYVVVLPTTRAFGETRLASDRKKDSLSSCAEISRRDRLVGRTLIGERIWDISRVIDWSLKNLPVDGTNIIMTGNSGGGTATIYAGAIDTRISLSMPGSAFCPFDPSIGSLYHCECNYVPAILDLGDMQDILGLTAPRTVHVIHGVEDPIFPIEDTRKAMKELQTIYTAAGAPDACSIYEGDGGHRFYKAGAWDFVKNHLLPVRPENVVVAPESPFDFKPLEMYVFPEKTFPITKYGAKKDDAEATQKAFAKAMEACNKAGGGKVVVPEGEWLTGPVSFRSNCNLYLSEGAKLIFSDDLKLFPIVRTTWEAMEVLNYSPLLYAFECENVAITGSGTLEAKMDFWYDWYDRPSSHLEATRKIATMASSGIPYDQRKAYEEGARMRPPFVEFNRCTNVQFADFKLRNSPMWCLHLFMCKDIWVHDLDIHAEGHNSDGIDVDMTQHGVIERCNFYQNDDAICFKAGRNKDAWDLATPTKDIVARYCNIECGGSFMAAGSELSAGINSVYVHHCTGQNIANIMRVKTNERRGGEVFDIIVEDCFTKNCRTVVSMDTDVMFQYRTLVPTFEVKRTKIHDMEVRNVSSDFVETLCEVLGDAKEPVKRIALRHVTVGEVSKTMSRVNNAEDIVMDDITVDNYSKSGKKHTGWSHDWAKFKKYTKNVK